MMSAAMATAEMHLSRMAALSWLTGIRTRWDEQTRQASIITMESLAKTLSSVQIPTQRGSCHEGEFGGPRSNQPSGLS